MFGVFLARRFGHLRHLGSEQRLRALSKEKRERGRGYVIQAVKVIRGLPKIRGHRGALLQIRGVEYLEGTGNDSARAFNHRVGKQIV